MTDLDETALEGIKRARQYAAELSNPERVKRLRESNGEMPLVVGGSVVGGDFGTNGGMLVQGNLSGGGGRAVEGEQSNGGGVVLSNGIQLSLQQQQLQQQGLQEQRALGLMGRIYVGSLQFDLGEEDVKQCFCVLGPVKSISMSIDPLTKKHKGFCFLEYEVPESAVLALAHMDGVLLGTRTLKVGKPNNVPAMDGIIDKIKTDAKEFPRVFVCSIHPELGEDDVKAVFEAFGKVKSMDMLKDTNSVLSGNRKHKGCGYIHYENQLSAEGACQAMNNFDLGGQLLKVCMAITPPSLTPGKATSSIMPNNSAAAIAAAAAAAVSAKLSESVPPEQRTGGIDGSMGTGNDVRSLVNEENVSISGASQRLLLMEKLSRKSSNSVAGEDNQSRVIVLKNMVGIDEVDEDLEGEVQEECQKFGEVRKIHIYVANDTSEVRIFVKFTSPSSTTKCVEAMNGRWFAGRQISALIYKETDFDSESFDK
eukprot:Nk52_evm1s1999 gene=Nk52_evmTU1s1999